MKKVLVALKDGFPSNKAQEMGKQIEKELGLPVVLLYGVEQVTVVDAPDEEKRNPGRVAAAKQ